MKILYRADEGASACLTLTWASMGIDQCILKYLSAEQDRSRITKKRHHHTGIELHMIESGFQCYEIGGSLLRVESGHFLQIMPQVAHVAVEESSSLKKFALYLQPNQEDILFAALQTSTPFLVGAVPSALWELLRKIRREIREKNAYGDLLIHAHTVECAVWCVRNAVGLDFAGSSRPEEWNDTRILLAKRYIEDNLSRPLSVTELAAYCSVSEKQLTRNFRQGEGCSVAAYIRRQRFQRAEQLLRETDLSICQVSDLLGFSSEYYFNAFFKKYGGMTPGAYQKSLKTK